MSEFYLSLSTGSCLPIQAYSSSCMINTTLPSFLVKETNIASTLYYVKILISSFPLSHKFAEDSHYHALFHVLEVTTQEE